MNEQPEPIATKFPTLDAWVDLWLLPTVEMPRDTESHWCEVWWRHPEVVARLDALWMAWEAARLGPAGEMSGWWSYHYAPHMRAITDGRGPFARCKHDDTGAKHRRWPELPSRVGPAELFNAAPVTR